MKATNLAEKENTALRPLIMIHVFSDYKNARFNVSH